MSGGEIKPTNIFTLQKAGSVAEPAKVPEITPRKPAAPLSESDIGLGADKEEVSPVESKTEITTPTEEKPVAEPETAEKSAADKMVQAVTAAPVKSTSQTATTPTEVTKKTASDVKPEAKEIKIEEEELAENPEAAKGSEGKISSDAEGPQRLANVMSNLDKLSEEQKGVAASHAKAKTASRRKARSASKAAPSPRNEAAAHGKGSQVRIMGEQEKKEIDKKGFVELVKSKLREMEMPKNPKEMEDFKKSGGASGLKADVLKGAKDQQANAQGNIATATSAEPTPAAARKPGAHPRAAKPPSPRKIVAENVLPAPKSEAEISLKEGSDEVEAEAAKENLSKERLQKANEPSFTAAQQSREKVHEHAKAGPRQYRQTEQDTLKSEKAALYKAEKAAATQMNIGRKQSDANVLGQQKKQMSQEQLARKKIADDLEAIYAQTKKVVENKLSWLDKEVDKEFTKFEKLARKRFEDFIEIRFYFWKVERYSDFDGKLTWITDRFRDINELKDVKQIYLDGELLYIKELEKGIDAIGKLIDTTLDWCQDQIKTGRDKVKQYLTNLKGNLKKLGIEAGQEVLGKFTDLKDQVNDYRDALADKLAQKYQDSREKLNARIEEIKDANRSLVIKAKRAIQRVIEAVRKFRTRLSSLLSKVRDTVEKIIEDPIAFLKNLIKAVKQGFNQFKKNIGKHLKAGIFGWLFGTFAGAGIELPKDFSAKSVVGFILQLLGITWDRIRRKAVRLIGKRNVAVIEKVAGYLKTLFREGPAGLWHEIKDDLGNLKELVIDSIKDWLIAKIIKAAVLKLVSMFNPVGAIIQAVLAIYNLIMFFVERIDQILQLVETVINALAPIVAGKIDTAANFIEKAMGQMIPLIIAFLARLLGIGGIAKRVKKIINRVRRRVDKAIDKALKKIIGKFKVFIGKGTTAVKKGAKKVGEKVKSFVFPKRSFQANGKVHNLLLKKRGNKGIFMIASSPEQTVANYLYKFRPKINNITDSDKNKEADAHYKKALELRKSFEAPLQKVFVPKKGSKKEQQKIYNSSSQLIKIIKKLWKLVGVKDTLLKDETKVGAYGEIPAKKGMHRHHMPQNAVLNRLARWLNVYLDHSPGSRKIKKARLSALGIKYTEVMKYDKSKGIAMYMRTERHKATRTYGKKKLLANLDIPSMKEWSDKGKHASDAKIAEYIETVQTQLIEDKKDVRAIYSGKKGLPKAKDPSNKVSRSLKNVSEQNKRKWGKFLG